MATRKKTTPAKPKAPASRSSASKPKAPSPKSLAANMKPVRVVPTSPIVHSKTLANGEPRPKSRRSK